MSTESLLHRLKDECAPSTTQKDSVRSGMMQRISHMPLFAEAKKQAHPLPAQRAMVWQHVLHRIDNPRLAGLFGQVREMFTPLETSDLSRESTVLDRLMPVRSATQQWLKWTAAFVLVLVAVRVSPVLFLAPHSIAHSVVMVVPTRGSVEVLLHDLWQPVTDEITLNKGAQLRTSQGEASILLHDDGTVRLSDRAEIILHDISDRPAPAQHTETLTLTQGRIWVQGLLARHLRGIIVATPFGDVSVHDGSVSLAVVDNALTVRVWSRHASVRQGEAVIDLVAGEKARFGQGAAGQITGIADEEYVDAWVKQNLERDAVHQREIAQMQQERRAAAAGILPTSPLYPVKRVAEQVDVLFTIDPAARVQKQLDVASTRLNEAAALIAEGGTGADVPLREYAETLKIVASGTGADSMMQILVRQEIAENTAALSAAQPNDDGYLLKKAVLESSINLPADIGGAANAESTIVVDTLDALQQAIDAGDTEKAQETYDELEPYLANNSGSLTPGVQREIEAVLREAAQELHETSSGAIADLTQELSVFLPPVTQPAVIPLTDEQVDALIERMMNRVYVYDLPRSRVNQLHLELRKISGHVDEGRILRRLYAALPDQNLTQYVRRAIQELREEKK